MAYGTETDIILARGGGQKVLSTYWGGFKKVSAVCEGGSRKFDDENFQLPSPHQSIYEHTLNK